MNIPLPSRTEMLALDLPIELHCVSITPSGVKTPVVVRFASEAARDLFVTGAGRAAALVVSPLR